MVLSKYKLYDVSETLSTSVFKFRMGKNRTQTGVLKASNLDLLDYVRVATKHYHSPFYNLTTEADQSSEILNVPKTTVYNIPIL
jgi:hypothetical protein